MCAYYPKKERQAEALNGPLNWTNVITKYSDAVVLQYLETYGGALTFQEFITSTYKRQPRGPPLFKDVTIYVTFAEHGGKKRSLIKRKGVFTFNPSSNDWWDKLNTAVSAYEGHLGNKVEITIGGSRVSNDRASLGKIYNAAQYQLRVSVSHTERADNYSPMVRDEASSTKQADRLQLIAMPTTTSIAVELVSRTSELSQIAREKLLLREKLRGEQRKNALIGAPLGASSSSSSSQGAATNTPASKSEGKTSVKFGEQMADLIAVYMATQPGKRTRLVKNSSKINEAIRTSMQDSRLYAGKKPADFWSKRGQNQAEVETRVAHLIADSLSTMGRSFLPRSVDRSDEAAVHRHAKMAYKKQLIGSGIFERIDKWLSQFDEDDDCDGGPNETGPARPLFLSINKDTKYTDAPSGAPWDDYRFSGWRPSILEKEACVPECHAHALRAPVSIGMPRYVPQQQQQQQIIINAPHSYYSDSSDEESVNQHHACSSEDSDSGSSSSSSSDEDSSGKKRRSVSIVAPQKTSAMVETTAVATDITKEAKVESDTKRESPPAEDGRLIDSSFNPSTASNFLQLFKVVYVSLDNVSGLSVALPTNEAFTDQKLTNFVNKNIVNQRTDADRKEMVKLFVREYVAESVSGGKLISKTKRIFTINPATELRLDGYEGVIFFPISVLHIDAPRVQRT